MKTVPRPFNVHYLCHIRDRVDEQPDYQRPAVWSIGQKRLLIDSVLRGYDMPKLYWQEVARDDGVQYEVVDGQQRLRALWGYHKGEFALARDADAVEGLSCAGCSYSELPPELKDRFDSYSVDVVLVMEAVQNTREDEVRDMFLRLQSGTTLKAQEKRHAMTGKMRDFVISLAGHKFFTESCKFQNHRYSHEHVAAQMMQLTLEDGVGNTTDSYLNKMYDKYTDFDTGGKYAKKTKRTLDALYKAFPERSSDLERYNVIALYALMFSLGDSFVCDQRLYTRLREWFTEFESERAADRDRPEDKRSLELAEYQGFISQSTDKEESIRSRRNILERRFLESWPGLKPKDSRRQFTDGQRRAIYHRDERRCQLKIECDGTETLGWDEWEADHIVPYAKGGLTTVENGQVACRDCNRAKGADS